MPYYRRPSAILSLAIVLLGSWPIPADAAITLNANFDSGSLKSYSVNGNTVNLVGRDSYAGSGNNLGDGHWRWLSFKATGVQGLNPTFSISKNFAGDSVDDPSIERDDELYDHEMVYSYDGENWEFFQNNQLGATRYTFSTQAPFTQNEVFVAYALPYTYARTVAHTQTVLASPWAAPTTSGNATGVIGQAPAGVDDIGRNIPSLDLFAYRITNPATDSAIPKRRAMLVTGQHAAETLGMYTYEGLINWLISDDPRAAALRDKAEFFGYPTLNASGRYAGLTRAMLQFPNTDSNGFWHPGPSGNNYNSPVRTEQKTNAQAMLTDEASSPGDSLDLFVDFHSSVPDYEIAAPNGLGSESPYDGQEGDFRDDWGYIRSGFEDNEWWQAFRELQPNILQINSGSGPTSRTMTGFAQNDVYGLNADMSVTFENQFAISRPISYYHDLGANAGLAMYEAWVRVSNPMAGDFDEDGDVDSGDLKAWTLGFGVSLSAAHYQGDANDDGDVDGDDFLVWQRQIGFASQDASQKAIPEPRGAWIAILSSAILILNRRPYQWVEASLANGKTPR